MTIQKAFTRASLIARLEAGPLGSYLADLEAALCERHYATETIQKCLHSALPKGPRRTPSPLDRGGRATC
jgi:hypothetical protein